MAKGGVRLGSGRPKGTKSKKTLQQIQTKQQARELLKEIVFKEFKPMIEAQVDLAKGVKIAKMNVQGEIESIYQEKPNTTAFELLSNQAIGRPENEIDKPIINIFNLRALGTDELAKYAEFQRTAEGGTKEVSESGTGQEGISEAEFSEVRDLQRRELPSELAPQIDNGEIGTSGNGKDKEIIDKLTSACR